MKYTVRIEEVLVKEIEVEATTQYEARCKVEDMYDAGEVVLDSDDFCYKDIDIAQ